VTIYYLSFLVAILCSPHWFGFRLLGIAQEVATIHRHTTVLHYMCKCSKAIFCLDGWASWWYASSPGLDVFVVTNTQCIKFVQKCHISGCTLYLDGLSLQDAWREGNGKFESIYWVTVVNQWFAAIWYSCPLCGRLNAMNTRGNIVVKCRWNINIIHNNTHTHLHHQYYRVTDQIFME
jgi:hypothetical protein